MSCKHLLLCAKCLALRRSVTHLTFRNVEARYMARIYSIFLKLSFNIFTFSYASRWRVCHLYVEILEASLLCLATADLLFAQHPFLACYASLCVWLDLTCFKKATWMSNFCIFIYIYVNAKKTPTRCVFFLRKIITFFMGREV